jgi:hypothetical protein
MESPVSENKKAPSDSEEALVLRLSRFGGRGRSAFSVFHARRLDPTSISPTIRRGIRTSEMTTSERFTQLF